MKKDGFSRFVVNHEGYIAGLSIVLVCLIMAIATKIPAAVYVFSALLSLMSLATYFGFKKWKRNQ